MAMQRWAALPVSKHIEKFICRHREKLCHEKLNCWNAVKPFKLKRKSERWLAEIVAKVEKIRRMVDGQILIARKSVTSRKALNRRIFNDYSS